MSIRVYGPFSILLSRLKPSPIACESGDDLDPFVFMRFIMKCSSQSNLRVRVLASHALVGLVANEKLQGVLLRIASALPSNGAQGGSFNYLHGILLQLGNLLDTNCRDLVDESKKDQITGQLMDVLAKCTWMASCPYPILSTSFLRVLDHMRVIGLTCSESKSRTDIYKLHLDLSTNCLDADASYGFSYYDPTIAELREEAAVSYFGCVFQPSDEATEVFQITHSPNLRSQKVPDLKERLLRCISDQSYEVRLATLKWFLQFLKSEDSSFSETSSIWDWAKNSLQVILLELLDKEKNHKCENYILRILCQWNLLMFKKSSNGGNLLKASMLVLWIMIRCFIFGAGWLLYMRAQDVSFTDIVSKIPFAGDICSEISSFSSLSRLCLIQGILTAVSRGVLVSSFARLSNSDCDHKTILYDGILPELCDLCENPIDSHLNFLALTVMQICLQQIKTSTINDLAEGYDPMPESQAARVVKTIWNNLED